MRGGRLCGRPLGLATLREGSCRVPGVHVPRKSTCLNAESIADVFHIWIYVPAGHGDLLLMLILPMPFSVLTEHPFPSSACDLLVNDDEAIRTARKHSNNADDDDSNDNL